MKYITLIAVLLAAIVSPTYSKSYGGGGSRSFSSSSKSYSSPSKSTSSWSKSTSSQTSTRVTSNVDSAKYKAAVSSGKAFPTRAAAISDFKAKNASTYTSKYTSEPSTRPAHIPKTTRVGGKSYDVVYDQRNGGYGYWSGGPGIGTFMLYDAMSDAIMMNTLMSSKGYYVGAPPTSHSFAGTFFLTIICAFIVIVIAVVIFSRIS